MRWEFHEKVAVVTDGQGGRGCRPTCTQGPGQRPWATARNSLVAVDASRLEGTVFARGISRELFLTCVGFVQPSPARVEEQDGAEMAEIGVCTAKGDGERIGLISVSSATINYVLGCCTGTKQRGQSWPVPFRSWLFSYAIGIWTGGIIHGEN